jgi:hypothetical protein
MGSTKHAESWWSGGGGGPGGLCDVPLPRAPRAPKSYEKGYAKLVPLPSWLSSK